MTNICSFIRQYDVERVERVERVSGKMGKSATESHLKGYVTMTGF